MMGIGAPGEVSDMLTLCERPQDDFYTGIPIIDWNKEGMITGFKGSFEGIPENSSSIIIDELEKEGAENRVLSIYKLEMSYQEVSQKIPELWKQQFRNFAIHFAPHSVKNRIYIEQRAFSDGYCREDVRGFVPEGNEAPSERREPVMESKQNCDELAKKVNEKLGLDGEKYGGLMVEKSEDPGRFVDGFLFYISLNQSPWNTILVKLPPFEGECTKEVVLDVVRGIIQMVSS